MGNLLYGFAGVPGFHLQSEYEPVETWRDVTEECEPCGGDVNLFHDGKRITKPTDFRNYRLRKVTRYEPRTGPNDPFGQTVYCPVPAFIIEKRD